MKRTRRRGIIPLGRNRGSFVRWWNRRIERLFWRGTYGTAVYPQTQGMLSYHAERHALQAEFDFSRQLERGRYV